MRSLYGFVDQLGVPADDIYEYPPARQPLYGIVGGAGPYAAFAARMFEPGERSKLVGLILHEGKDFPVVAKRQIEALDMHAKFIDRADSNTTRGSNVYDADGNRSKFNQLLSSGGARTDPCRVRFRYSECQDTGLNDGQ